MRAISTDHGATHRTADYIAADDPGGNTNSGGAEIRRNAEFYPGY
jgi:hypothetical protein